MEDYIESISEAYNYAITNELSQEEQDLIIDSVARKDKRNFCYLFAVNVPNLTEQNLEKLVDKEISKEKKGNFWLFASKVRNLNERQRNKLLDAQIAFGTAPSICKFALSVPGLTRKNIDEIVKVIIELNDVRCIYKILVEVSDLTYDNIKALTEAIIESKELRFIYKLLNIDMVNKAALINIIIESKNIGYIYEMINSNALINFGITISELNDINELEKIVLESKNHILITKYIIWKKDINLILAIFNDLDMFIRFCFLHMKELDLSNEKILELEEMFNLGISIFDFKFVDDNIENILKKENTVK